MKLQLLVTKTDFCLPNLERELIHLGFEYDVLFIEDHPDMVANHKIRHSPNILINGDIAFRHQPTETELRNYFADII